MLDEELEVISMDLEYALDYIKKELKKNGRRVDISVFSLNNPARYLFERGPWYQFWNREEMRLAVEEKWNHRRIISYDRSDEMLCKAMEEAKNIFPNLQVDS